jgi:hypothetical protein
VIRRLAIAIATAVSVGVLATIPSVASASGQSQSHRPIVTLGSNQSSNWSGYNQGALEQGGTLFDSISGTWVVPTAKQHEAGEAEYSSSWIGIGGGCIDAQCTLTDGTLIQAGTEQDVNSGGQASYHAWWELIPAPSIRITGFAVRPGDRISATIAEMVSGSNVWKISLRNVTTGQSWSMTVPYSSSHLTAEWIEETPLVIGGGAGVAALPNLGTVRFSATKVNGQNANLRSSEAIQLVDANTSKILATPSAPNSAKTAFNDCTYSRSCAAPR